MPEQRDVKARHDRHRGAVTCFVIGVRSGARSGKSLAPDVRCTMMLPFIAATPRRHFPEAPTRERSHLPPHPRHRRPALRQRRDPPRPPGRRLPARRLLRPLPAAAWPAGAVHLRHRRVRRAHHPDGRARGHQPQGAGGPQPRVDQGVVRRPGHRVRQLFPDQPPDPRRDRTGVLHRPARPGAPGAKDDRAVLQPHPAAVPGRPVHRGHVPEVRQPRRPRRPVRGLRLEPRPHRAHRSS